MTKDEKMVTLANSLSKMIGGLETCKSYLLDAIKVPTDEAETKMAREVLSSGLILEGILRGHGSILMLLEERGFKAPPPIPTPTSSDPSMN